MLLLFVCWRNTRPWTSYVVAHGGELNTILGLLQQYNLTVEPRLPQVGFSKDKLCTSCVLLLVGPPVGARVGECTRSVEIIVFIINMENVQEHNEDECASGRSCRVVGSVTGLVKPREESECPSHKGMLARAGEAEEGESQRYNATSIENQSDTGSSGKEVARRGKEVEGTEKRQPEWIDFSSWLQGQRGKGSPAVVGSTSAAENNPISDVSQRERRCLGSVSPEDLGRSQEGGLDRHPLKAVARQGPLLPKDCRLESRLLFHSGRNIQGRQERSILLAKPGMPSEMSTMLPTKDAGALLSALYEPLVEVSVGVLVRKLECPTKLQPLEDMGTLSLWLLPNEDLSLVFQAQMPKKAIELIAPGTDMLSILQHGLKTIENVKHNSIEISLWEELARFPRMREEEDPGMGVDCS